MTFGANDKKPGKHWKIIVGFSSIILIVLLIIFIFPLFSKKASVPVQSAGEAISQVTEGVTTGSPVLEIEISPTENADTPSISETLDTNTQELSAGSVRVSEIDGMEQVFVPAGEFLMGTNDVEAKRDIGGGRAYPEIPQFTYYLDSFWIDKYEVTNKQYHECMDAGACTEPHRIGSYTYPDYFTNSVYDNYPVIWITWFQANDYCEWAGRRLPTEAEWEKAARGTDGRKYPWGDDPYTVDKANICDENCTRTHRLEGYDDGYADLAPIGSYPAGVSPYGALDMAGNVWEWNSTEIRLYPYDANDGREDPGGIDIERGWRGSSWANGLWWLRSSVRYHALDFYSWYVLGVRCAATPD
mgnify:FL=1